MSDRRKKNRYSEEDDGRVIAPMNVEGMPWYAPKPKTPKSSAPQEAPTKEEMRAYRFAALKAGLLIAGAFPVLLLLAVSRLRRRPKGEQ